MSEPEAEEPTISLIVLSDEEERRRYVFESMANSELDCNILIKNMESCYQWLKDGILPEQQQKPKRSLRPVQE